MKNTRGDSMTKMWVIARPINGISLNGLEYMTDDNNMMYVYKTKEQAYAHLYELGCTDDYTDISSLADNHRCIGSHSIFLSQGYKEGHILDSGSNTEHNGNILRT